MSKIKRQVSDSFPLLPNKILHIRLGMSLPVQFTEHSTVLGQVRLLLGPRRKAVRWALRSSDKFMAHASAGGLNPSYANLKLQPAQTAADPVKTQRDRTRQHVKGESCC